MEALLSFLQPLVEAYAGKFGVVVQVIAVVGSLRVFIKPLMSLADTYVLFTKTEKDNEFLAKLKENKIYKAVVYVLDWFASIKIK